ncbi:manganese efflux pump MntP [bioreactor metagenome]|uniref:Manganese efflux pump MntP n=1 Tax=bioreactor metagenome TaxID=1076179 RepID=A0A644WXP5_9ZZZZ
MHFGAIFFLAIAVNLDNLCLGISCGLIKKHIPWYHNLIVAFISGLFGALSCGAAHLIPEKFSLMSALLGSFILFGSGAWAIIRGIKKQSIVPPDCPRPITSLREILLLSVALALNCIGVSFGMGMSDVPFILLGTSVAALSLICVSIGNYLGESAARLAKSNWIDILSGVLLIIVGVWEWLV